MEDIPQIGIPELYADYANQKSSTQPKFILLKPENMPEYIKSGNPFRNVNYCISFFVESNSELNIDFNSYKPKKKHGLFW